VPLIEHNTLCSSSAVRKHVINNRTWHQLRLDDEMGSVWSAYCTPASGLAKHPHGVTAIPDA